MKRSLTVTMSRDPKGYEVAVSDWNGGEFAKVFTGDPHTAMQHAMPYIAAMVEEFDSPLDLSPQPQEPEGIPA